jgi:hypothetical protein
MGLATEAASPLSSLPKRQRLPADRLEFAVGEEGHQHLLSSDNHRYQDGDRCPAYDRVDWLDLVALGPDQALSVKPDQDQE